MSTTRWTIHEVENWDEEQLLEWVRRTKPNIFRDDEDVLTFKVAKIDGSVFLENAKNLDFFKQTHLPLGVYSALAALAGIVSKQRDKTDTPEEPPISPKRRQKDEDEDELTQLAIEASKRRKAIKDMITQMNDFPNQYSNSVDPLPGAVDKLSNPTLNHTLDFPFVGPMPERFKEPGIARRKWLYMGRTMFKYFLQEVKKVRKSRSYERCWLYGTQGFGKSRLLAALVCYFAAQDERVVYLPDYQALLDDPVPYVVVAMLFAWADDFATQKKIIALRTEDQIEIFCKNQKNVIFIVDQMSALKTKGIANRQEAERIRRWVNRFTFVNKAIFSSSANCANDLEGLGHQSPNWVVPVYGGFTKMEMEQWWKQHEDIRMGGYSRNQVEDVTGCIPLLLNRCVVNGAIDLAAPELIQISDESVAFTQRIKSTATKYDWEWYCDYVRACIRNQPISPGWTAHIELIDHRYFYQFNDIIGGCSCGLVRDAVANKLLEL
ncbi:uncharacterized protein Z518_03174 [Rhinocladiella mackenziei CBS 650.93]|uniref:Uncharacterized protein n=1 Tax=Rhinocladiella mackenziei CBS 650.93 TaxID=1442369 RepID=A0A0D2HDF3_9EURO|nr:uncharacterized protein Z518_03174 [Rhinocladiella mackenziei CBS 650.93]KIX08518.1 hypothetical protein Z518_03174 [Rhinocladiella mackenziei CBS 650.93]